MDPASAPARIGPPEGCPDCWELGGGVGVAVGELIAVPGQAQGGEQVRGRAGADEGLGEGDLG